VLSVQANDPTDPTNSYRLLNNIATSLSISSRPYAHIFIDQLNCFLLTCILLYLCATAPTDDLISQGTKPIRLLY
jgi:hypothetical protein